MTRHSLRCPLHLIGGAALLLACDVARADPPPDSGPAASSCAGASGTLGQRRIDQGRYQAAIDVFTCVIANDPTDWNGWRGRAEAELRLGRYADAMHDYARITAVVMPDQPDAAEQILSAYDERLGRHPNDVAALTGASFAHWWYFDYPATLPLLGRLLELSPDDRYGILYRGSNRLFVGEVEAGMADFEQALALSPTSADVRFIVADGYTYAYPDPQRAQAEAMLALDWGLDTPRVHAILASSAFALGDDVTGAYHIGVHIDLVTTEMMPTAALEPGSSLALDLVAGRTFEMTVTVSAGETLSIRTESPSGAIWDSVVALRDPDGAAVAGNDDFIDYFAGFDWVASEAGTYTLQVTTFEGVSAGDLVVTRL
ncbi:MAG: hypothetical protein IT379_38835 [Deltaproteobacteria bacterium]|nr:hypothetical protein [Deltaproteobacteria bacterium]